MIQIPPKLPHKLTAIPIKTPISWNFILNLLEIVKAKNNPDNFEENESLTLDTLPEIQMN
jgi:hypothetical protein